MGGSIARLVPAGVGTTFEIRATILGLTASNVSGKIIVVPPY
jgi:hypothetical protein